MKFINYGGVLDRVMGLGGPRPACSGINPGGWVEVKLGKRRGTLVVKKIK